MATTRTGIGLLLLALGLLGCGGSIKGNTGPDGGTPTGACPTLSACECLAASDRCASSAEACWCPSECAPPGTVIDCVCGGGRFLECRDLETLGDCGSRLAAVQAKCSGQAFVQYIGDICSGSARRPTCVADCLAKLEANGSCSEIDCSFCPVCDCAPTATQSPFAACLAGCAAPPLGE